MIAVDAAVVAVALADDGPDGDQARARLRGERLAAPERRGKINMVPRADRGSG